MTIGWHVLHEGSSSTIIEEIDRHPHTTTRVCGCESTVEVWEEIDICTIVPASGENAWNRDPDVWHGICGRSVRSFTESRLTYNYQ